MRIFRPGSAAYPVMTTLAFLALLFATFPVGSAQAIFIENENVNSSPSTGMLTIDKVVVGSDAAPSSFSFVVQSGDFIVSMAGDESRSLPLGFYAVTETEASSEGYDVSYAGDCVQGVFVTPSGTTCTVTNTRSAPSVGYLTIVKEIQDGDSVTTTTSSDFQFDVEGDGTEITTGPVTRKELAPGQYSLREQANEDYTFVSAGQGEGDDCVDEEGLSVEIIAGQEATCTFRNAPVPVPEGAVDMTLVFKNISGELGQRDVSVWTKDDVVPTEEITFLSGLKSFFFGRPAFAATVIPLTPGLNNLGAGAFQVFYSGAPGDYVVTLSGGCASGSFVISVPGPGTTCVVTFSQVGGGGGGPANGSLAVITNVINDSGTGLLLPAFATMTVTSSANPTSVFGGFSGAGITLGMAPGTFSVTSPALAGYVRSESGTCGGTLVSGGSATCIVTYDDIPPVVAAPPAPPVVPPTPPAPTPVVLGATDTVPETLPRTGTAAAMLLLPLVAAAALALRQRR